MSRSGLRSRFPFLFALLLPGVLLALSPARVAMAGDGARIAGTVRDPQGQAVAAARVVLDGPVGVARETRSDGGGAYAFDGVPPGRFRVRAFAEGFAATPVSVEVHGDQQALTADLSLQLAAITDRIVVSAANLEAPLSTVPASVTVISSEDLRVAQAEVVSEALRRVAGISVTSNGGRGALTSLFPRGGESDFTLVMFDGIRLNAFGGGFDAAHLPAMGIERVEVVRGPQSALFGADAIGGVVHVVSRRGGPLSLGAIVEGGTYETGRLGGEASGRVGTVPWHVAGQYLESQGRNGETSARGELVVNDDYLARHLTAGSGWEYGRGVVRGVFTRSSTSRGNPGPYGSDPNGTSSGIDAVARGGTDHLAGALSALHRVGPAARVRAEVSAADLDSTFRSQFGTSFTESRRYTGRGQVDWAPAGPWAVSAGAELLQERVRNTFITGLAATPVPIDRRVVGSFAEARVGDGQRLMVAGGLRAERITRDALEGNPSAFSPRPPFAADTVVSWNPKLAASWTVRPMGDQRQASTRVRLNAGTGIRPPDGFELAFTDNPGLKPERSRSIDVGVEQLLAGGRVALEAVFFANRYDDLIVAVGRAFSNASRYRTDNISNARARGLETSVAARLPASLHLRAGYTYLRTEILAVDGSSLAPVPFTVGQPLLRRPRHQGFVEATWTGDRVDAFVRTMVRGEVLDVDPSFGAFGGLVVAPGHETADVGLSWRPLGRAPHAVLLRVTNLFDRQYEEALGFPALGRAVMVGVRVAHGR